MEDTHESYLDQIEELQIKVDSLEATLIESSKCSGEWMNEAIAGRDAIQQLKVNNQILDAELHGATQREDDLRKELQEREKIIEALQNREQNHIRRMNNAIFILEDHPPLNTVDDVFARLEDE
jgi:predicted RNase H-like nuclease (RuvC/YqgF family)